jgi:hypothetical protein
MIFRKIGPITVSTTDMNSPFEGFPEVIGLYPDSRASSPASVSKEASSGAFGGDSGFVIQFPKVLGKSLSETLSANFLALYSALESSGSKSVSVTELKNKFIAIPIPDFGSESLSPAMGDFVPYVYHNGYKIDQKRIAVIRSFAAKKAVVLIDRADNSSNQSDYYSIKDGDAISYVIDSAAIGSGDKGTGDSVSLTWIPSAGEWHGVVTPAYRWPGFDSLSSSDYSIVATDSSGSSQEIDASSYSLQMSDFRSPSSNDVSTSSGSASYSSNEHVAESNDQDVVSKQSPYFGMIAKSQQFSSQYHVHITLKGIAYRSGLSLSLISRRTRASSSSLIDGFSDIYVFGFGDGTEFSVFYQGKKLIPGIDYSIKYAGGKVSGITFIADYSSLSVNSSGVEIVPRLNRLRRFDIATKTSSFGVDEYLMRQKIYKNSIDLTKAFVEVFSNGLLSTSATIAATAVSGLTDGAYNEIIIDDYNTPDKLDGGLSDSVYLTKASPAETTNIDNLLDGKTGIYKGTSSAFIGSDIMAMCDDSVSGSVSDSFAPTRDIVAYDISYDSYVQPILQEGEVYISGSASTGYSIQGKDVSSNISAIATSMSSVMNGVASSMATKLAVWAETGITIKNNIKKIADYTASSVVFSPGASSIAISNGTFMALYLEMATSDPFDMIVSKQSDSSVLSTEYGISPAVESDKKYFIHIPFYYFGSPQLASEKDAISISIIGNSVVKMKELR